MQVLGLTLIPFRFVKLSIKLAKFFLKMSDNRNYSINSVFARESVEEKVEEKVIPFFFKKKVKHTLPEIIREN